jgi:hypothetical protein
VQQDDSDAKEIRELREAMRRSILAGGGYRRRRKRKPVEQQEPKPDSTD